MIDKAQRGIVVRMFGSALASQAVLSGASFLVGLLLLRRTSDLEYGYYVLMTGAIILAVSLQNAFIAPAMISRMTQLGRLECGDLTGGLYREQRRVILGIAGVALAITLVLWIENVFDTRLALLVLAAIAAMVMALRREYFRMVLHAYRHAFDVFRGDLIYILLLVLGIVLATSTAIPAISAALAVTFAAGVAGVLLSQVLRRNEAWNAEGEPGILRQIAPIGAWSTAGAAIHWTFSQGYAVLAAATLDVGAVAAIAATRMLAMPVSLLSAGIGPLMLPLAARWLHDSGVSLVLRRLLWLALALAAVSACYFAVLWIMRDWVFEVVLNKQFEQRDLLLMLWAACFIVMAFNQQLLWLLIARTRFPALTMLTLVSATLAMSCSYLAMRRLGGAGAPLGILVGELVYTVGIAFLCLRETAADGRERGPAVAAMP